MLQERGVIPGVKMLANHGWDDMDVRCNSARRYRCYYFATVTAAL
jgi:hypothetical protein